MKRSFAFSVLIVVLNSLTSCESDHPTPEASSSIDGRWELRIINNGQGESSTYSAGNGSIYEFTDKTYKRYEGGNLKATGAYLISEQRSPISDQTIRRILFDDEIDHPDDYIRTSVERTNTTLILAVDANDGPSSVYEKVE